MKKITFATAVISLIGTFAMGDSFPAEGKNSYKAQQSEAYYEDGIYAGIGYSYMNANIDTIGNVLSGDITGHGISLLAGYQMTSYFAFEARYSTTLSDLSVDTTLNDIDVGNSTNGDMSNIGLYIKPMYTSGRVGLYGLLGIGKIKLSQDNVSVTSNTELQWGLGMLWNGGDSLIPNTDLSLYMDYTRLYQDSESFLNYSTNGINRIDVSVDSINVGLIWKF